MRRRVRAWLRPSISRTRFPSGRSASAGTSFCADAKRRRWITTSTSARSSAQERPMSEITPSQTVGPFFAYGLTPKGRCEWDPNGRYSWKETVGDNLITPDVSGEKIRIEGKITDGDGAPINDAMIEIWQADAQGRYASPRDPRRPSNARFKGFGR